MLNNRNKESDLPRYCFRAVVFENYLGQFDPTSGLVGVFSDKRFFKMNFICHFCCFYLTERSFFYVL